MAHEEQVEDGASPGDDTARAGSPWEVLAASLRLGLTSFGGPIAHLGYFHDAYVVRRRWLDAETYTDLVALCQMLPGPASSEVGIGVGLLRAGLPGALLAWLGFTLPSAVALTLFAFLVQHFSAADMRWLHGLQVVAVAVVAQAVWSMARNLSAGKERASLTVAAAILLLLWQSPEMQVAVIVLGALFGWRFLSSGQNTLPPPLHMPVSRRVASSCLILFLILLLALPLVRHVVNWQPLMIVDSFYRTGALVFGGGHVVLPLLQQAVVAPGWVTSNQFITGYGAAQAVPGPLFTFSAYLGAVMRPSPHGTAGAALALVSIFLPAFLLVIGILPFWQQLRQHPGLRAALNGINAAVVGLLLAALYNPIWITAIHRSSDVALALACFALLVVWRTPPWAVVLFAGVAGAVLVAVY